MFPGYGVLATVLVPPGTREVRLEASPLHPPWPLAWVLLGVGCCVAQA